jgi:hypothetical protein
MSSFNELTYVEHSNGEVTPVKVSTMTGYNLIKGITQTEVHIDMTYTADVDLTYLEDTDDDDSENGDYITWSSIAMQSQANSGTSFIFEPNFFASAGEEVDDPEDLYHDYIVEGHEDEETDEETWSVVSRLSTEDDGSGYRCLACATSSNGGWMHCFECYQAHFHAR